MNNLIINPRQMSKLASKSKIVGAGSYGVLYQLNDDILIKFNCKDFIDAYEFETLEYNHSERVNYVINAINKQDKVKHTNLPLGLALIDGVCVGYVLKNNKNMVNLYNYMEENESPNNVKETILNNINIATNELIENGIFHNDLTVRNIMAGVKTGEVQIKDTDDVACLTENEMKYNKDWKQIKTGFVKG